VGVGVGVGIGGVGVGVEDGLGVIVGARLGVGVGVGVEVGARLGVGLGESICEEGDSSGITVPEGQEEIREPTHIVHCEGAGSEVLQ